MGTGQIDSRRGVQKEARIRRVGTRQIDRRRVIHTKRSRIRREEYSSNQQKTWSKEEAGDQTSRYSSN